jgi:hypothetical protein
MFCTLGCPQSQEPMVGVRERPSATDGNEARVADFGEDHDCTFCVASAQLIIAIYLELHSIRGKNFLYSLRVKIQMVEMIFEARD